MEPDVLSVYNEHIVSRKMIVFSVYSYALNVAITVKNYRNIAASALTLRAKPIMESLICDVTKVEVSEFLVQ